MSAPQNPPPATVPSKAIVQPLKTAQQEIELSAEVVLDGTTIDAKIFGLTSYNPKGVVSQTPRYSYEKRGGVEIITKLAGPATVKGTVTIQTVYGPKASPTMRSGYGRGTTPEDEKNGDTSLGFHESCHRNDYLEFLRTKPLPVFGGRPGMTRTQYDQAAAAFLQAVNKYFEDMGKDSFQRTDEVGYKKSTYNAKGPRP